ncbi:MAG: hypothetical protein ACI4SX_06600, partial [Candidatus Fimenecus sp.]
TVLSGKYDMSPVSIKDVHDFGYVYFDGKQKAFIDRTKYTVPNKFSLKNLVLKKSPEDNSVMMKSLDGDRKIGVLVDTMGRVNYGARMLDRKGISDIYIGNQRQMGFDVWTLPLDNLENLKYAHTYDKNEPVFLKGTFKTESKADCFVHLDGFEKGYVFVNGFNLGRFWAVGPQKSLYLPGALLKEENEIIVLSLNGFSTPEVSILNTHNLG